MCVEEESDIDSNEDTTAAFGVLPIIGSHIGPRFAARCAVPLPSVGVGDLTDELGPGHVHGPIDYLLIHVPAWLQESSIES
jgi:hypothetical protein